MTGWNMPPGVNVRDIPGNEDVVCDCCGREVGDCICPQCHVCGVVGNPGCYDPGHVSDDVRLNGRLLYTKQQLIGQYRAHIAVLQSQIDEAEMGIAELEASD